MTCSTEQQLLFVYGTLRRGFDGPMACWLASVSQYRGIARAQGRLYRIDHYPGFVPGGAHWVAGDLLALSDAPTILATLDAYEECAPHFPEPHEYRRERLLVESPSGPVAAWTYVYALDVGGLARIESGDFLD
ncbi:MAG TPA: gamma-glutamylcyclotransferase family protein [Sphingobium sp.]|nr:gamma-glutamylcyclotransferase family protein [Sphingobium sp.]